MLCVSMWKNSMKISLDNTSECVVGVQTVAQRR